MAIERVAEVRQRWTSRVDRALLVAQHTLLPSRNVLPRIDSPHFRGMFDLNLLMPLLLIRLLPQTLRDTLIPRHHMLIWLARETRSGKNLRKDLPGIMVPHIVHRHRFPQETRMLFRSQQELNRLPHDPSLRLERRYSRIRKGRRMGISRWLETVQTSQALVDERNTLIRRAEKELIVIAVQVAVEMRQLVWCQVGLVGWFIPLVLYDC